MRSFNKVAIIGVGLIGGSLGLAIKNKGLAKEVVGVSRRRTTLALAKKKGAIDYGSQKLSVIKDADLVIFATPVSVILKLAPLIKKNIKPSCIVTDVASTKRKVTESLSRVFKNYVGTHPLAGSQKHGVLYARADIFKDSLCLIVPA
ncbi:MAG: prephenate dehydrogenase/arogenate dehydrogenase family protein, partial [Candidatus Omnitrophica bacterium]|nr:prephenate dehydrogenase/arogenate dehydrogenase family protein [Candidatus Omnitrophota bacterium]